MIRAENAGAVLGHATEGPASLMPVLHLLGHHAKVEGNPQHDGSGIAKPPLPGGIRLLKNATRGGRIVGPLMHGSELMRGGKHLRIILAKIDPTQVNGMLKHSPRLPQITGIGKDLRTLPNGM